MTYNAFFFQAEEKVADHLRKRTANLLYVQTSFDDLAAKRYADAVKVTEHYESADCRLTCHVHDSKSNRISAADAEPNAYG